MEGNPTHNYVCVYGDDYDLDHGIYSARNTVYSKTQRISIENIRKGNFDGNHVVCISKGMQISRLLLLYAPVDMGK